MMVIENRATFLEAWYAHGNNSPQKRNPRSRNRAYPARALLVERLQP
jgi:hypothetical protein